MRGFTPSSIASRFPSKGAAFSGWGRSRGGLYVPPQETVARKGLDWPANLSTNGASSDLMRFVFPDNMMAAVPATLIYRYYVRQHTGYYLPFIMGGLAIDAGGGVPGWDHDAGYTKIYWAPNPYPISKDSSGTTHKWAVSVGTRDFIVNGEYSSGANVVVSGSNTVTYDRWYTQAMSVRWAGTSIFIKFWYDLPDTSKFITVNQGFFDSGVYNTEYSPNIFGSGDAPWNPGNERSNGIKRGIQLYNVELAESEILTESANDTINIPQTALGLTSCVYLNQSPTPSDISKKYGIGSNPSWVNGNRPTLWEE